MSSGQYQFALQLDGMSRWVLGLLVIICCQWQLQTDHVHQKNFMGDIWLSEGGGMISKRTEYLDFLQSAVEHSTVSD